MLNKKLFIIFALFLSGCSIEQFSSPPENKQNNIIRQDIKSKLKADLNDQNGIIQTINNLETIIGNLNDNLSLLKIITVFEENSTNNNVEKKSEIIDSTAKDNQNTNQEELSNKQSYETSLETFNQSRIFLTDLKIIVNKSSLPAILINESNALIDKILSENKNLLINNDDNLSLAKQNDLTKSINIYLQQNNIQINNLLIKIYAQTSKSIASELQSAVDQLEYTLNKINLICPEMLLIIKPLQNNHQYLNNLQTAINQAYMEEKYSLIFNLNEQAIKTISESAGLLQKTLTEC